MKLDQNKLKMIGGGIVIALAFAIMMPGLMDYALRLGRMITVIIAALILAVILVNIWRYALSKRQEQKAKTSEPGAESSP